MEVFISQVKYFRELSVKSADEEYRVLSSSLEAWPDRLVLQIELTRESLDYARKDLETSVDSGRSGVDGSGSVPGDGSKRSSYPVDVSGYHNRPFGV